MLDKLKHLREVNFYEGTAAEKLHRRRDWEQAEIYTQVSMEKLVEVYNKAHPKA